MKQLLALVLGVALAAGCQKNDHAPAGDPAGRAPQGLPGAQGAGGGDPTALGVHDPGTGMGGDNPHAGMGGDNPHGGMQGMEGMAPPPQDLDPATLIEGVVDVSPALAAKVKPGDVIFLVAKAAGPDGQPAGPPLAVEKLIVADKLPQPFTLSNQNQMIQGAKLTGSVLVSARLDRDSEASSKNPGDLEGMLPVTPPAKGIKVVLASERQ
jgi:hypothetical protein